MNFSLKNESEFSEFTILKLQKVRKNIKLIIPKVDSDKYIFYCATKRIRANKNSHMYINPAIFKISREKPSEPRLAV